MRKIIKLLKRARKKNTQKELLTTYDICVVLKGSKCNRVYEKLGTYSRRGNRLSINIFRLIF
jgi:hypothetical protein